jgi:TolB-like protein/Tfp pilus assembly protein PilF
MDFGIARSLKADGITEAGTMIGSPEYMSPEQVEGQEIDQRSDIYSLGVVLYEMVAGRVPFEGDTAMSIALKHKKETPPNPREFNAQVPENFAQLILRCMEKDKRNRYQDTKELSSDLVEMEQGKHEARKASGIRWKNSIAVLPFADLSPEKDQEYFCDGLAEEIINALTKIKDLRVVARTSAFSFKDEKMDVREIGRKLEVKAVLEGSVRKAGSRLRITSQLINVSDGYHLWSEKYDRDMEDIFAIQDDVTLAIVDKLKVELIGKEVDLIKRHTKSLEAYNLYMKGRHFLRLMTKESMPKSLELFRQAIEKDPNYAMAYVGIAQHYNNLGFYNFVPPKKAFPKAKEAAEKALEIDDSLAEAHTARGFELMLHEWNWEEAEKAFQRASELNPSYSSAHVLHAHLLWIVGRFEEAIAEGSLARELNPLSRGVGVTMGTIYMSARQYDQSIKEFKKILEMDPYYFLAHFWMAFPYALKGMYKEAVETIEKAVSLSGRGSPLLWTFLGYIYAVSGKIEKAKKALEEMLELSKKTYVAPWMIASMYTGLDQKDEAFKWLEKSFKQRDHWLVYLKISPVVDKLRPDPRFKALVKKMGFK